MTSQTINTQAQEEDKSGLLRNTLKANAIFSTLSGLAFAVGAGSIADSVALEDGAWFLLLIGFGLLPFAAFVYYAATRPKIDRRVINSIIVMDISWVVGSAIVLLTDLLALNSAGNWGVLIIADVVLTFAVLQFVGLRRMNNT